ncbi:hypothetical protein [Rhodospira trueperi]|uniref:Uncharacterized protein n=1 Tax=Rhodospira trueperi TaxID=69960 RepID=A0A1G7HGW1_9PROT|nr:hypothetical protein [Rhodospira trueperi]SDE99655.1 hypothetical protein SAMN05421720_12110 [Rhodospira trueperi]
MTTNTTTNPDTQTSGGNARRNSNPPDFIAKQRIGYGKGATWERIGVAWQTDSGAIFLRIHGTQILSGGISLFREKEGDAAGA